MSLSFRFLFTLLSAVLGLALFGCQSGPRTWEEEEAAFQRNQRIQNYENQQQQQDMNELSDGDVSNPSGYDSQSMDF